MDQAKDLKIVGNYTVEYNIIKVDQVIKRGRVTNA